MTEYQKVITIAENEEYLRQISSSVDIVNDNTLLNTVDIIEKYCQEHDVLAIAAIQLGIPKRLIYLKNTNIEIINRIQTDTASKEDGVYNEARILINPVITNREGLTEYWESCASCLNNCGRVLRPYKIDIEYQSIDGNVHKEIFKGFESTVLSHEIDHLDGILHIDIAEEIKVMPSEARKKWRQNHGYQIFSENGSYEELKMVQLVKGVDKNV